MSDAEQRSAEWFAARCGCLTASKIADMMATTQKGWGASRATYAAQLIAERLTGTVAPSFSNAAMEWGTAKEPEARAAYEFVFDTPVVETGFVKHPTIAMSGASPDGLVGDLGLIEIKCPQTSTHIDTLRGAPIADKYIKQMHWQMLCTGRQWCDFASYDPRLPVEMQLHVTRVHLDAELATKIAEAAREFLDEIAATVRELESKYLPYPILAAG